jgi:hypothetical protein
MTKRRNTRKQQNGGGYSFGRAISPETPYAQEVIGGPRLTPDCLESTRPGLVNSASGNQGLPGFGSTMKGGRYTFDLTQGPINDIGSAGPSGGLAVVSRIGCEGGIYNTSPPGAASNPSVLQNGGVGGVDSASYIAPTAGYSNKASEWVSSSGSPSLLQTPYDARAMNPACLKTGGRRRQRKSRKSRRSSKNRKSRKSRK